MCRHTPRSLTRRLYETLEAEGRPLHYTDLLERVRRHHPRYRQSAIGSVRTYLSGHACFKLARQQGMYGLASWELPPYKTITESIIELLRKHGKPMRRMDIARVLAARKTHTKSSILVLLQKAPEVVRIEPGLYDLRERVERAHSET